MQHTLTSASLSCHETGRKNMLWPWFKVKRWIISYTFVHMQWWEWNVRAWMSEVYLFNASTLSNKYSCPLCLIHLHSISKEKLYSVSYWASKELPVSHSLPHTFIYSLPTPTQQYTHACPTATLPVCAYMLMWCKFNAERKSRCGHTLWWPGDCKGIAAHGWSVFSVERIDVFDAYLRCLQPFEFRSERLCILLVALIESMLAHAEGCGCSKWYTVHHDRIELDAIQYNTNMIEYDATLSN